MSDGEKSRATLFNDVAQKIRIGKSIQQSNAVSID
jgi:hypothetical protein